jgi:LysM repeat protein
MKSGTLVLVVLAIILGAVLLPGKALAQTNLIINGGCEDGTYGEGDIKNWIPWWEVSDNTGGGQFDYLKKGHWGYELAASAPPWVHSGNLSCRLWNHWDPWHAGILQVVNVPPGSRVRATAWGLAFAGPPESNSSTVSDSSVNARMQIGIDPNGGATFYSGVQWGPALSPHGAWTPFSIEATAGPAGKVTVYLSANYRGYSRGRFDSFWDDITLTVVGAEAPTATPGSSGGGGNTPAPTSRPRQPFVMPTPGPDGNVVYVVQEGDTLWGIAALAGLTVDELKAMNGLSTDIIFIGQRLIIGPGSGAGATSTPAATTDPSLPTEAPTTAGEASASATPAQVTSATGTICALMYQDSNGNGRRDESEGLLAGGQMAVVEKDTGTPVQAYTTTGEEVRSHCFENLPVNTYTISALPPQGYNSTNANSTTLIVEADSLSNIEFGAQPSGSGVEEPTSRPARDDRRLRTALFGAAGVVFLLLAAGIAGFLVLRRR